MTKKQLAQALTRAKQIAAEPSTPPIESIARAYGYLERAVEEYTEMDQDHHEYVERRKLARHGIKY